MMRALLSDCDLRPVWLACMRDKRGEWGYSPTLPCITGGGSVELRMPLNNEVRT